MRDEHVYDERKEALMRSWNPTDWALILELGAIWRAEWEKELLSDGVVEAVAQWLLMSFDVPGIDVDDLRREAARVVLSLVMRRHSNERR